MPKIDFNTVDDAEDFSPLPDGQYLCRLQDVEEALTQHGDEMWKLRFVVAEGEHEDRYVFDNLVFSAAALKRVKLICSRLGLDVSGELDVTPELLQGRSCQITVDTETYEDEAGKTKRRNIVPFAGYDRYDDASGADDLSEDELVF